jgi:putative ribosome biogenesis GTPase RsgA
MRLAGRQDELGVLVDLVLAATGRRGSAVIVRGPAGIGKSSLVNALLPRVAGTVATWSAAQAR